MSIYWTWSYPWEAQRDPAEMDNRFSTMTEVRNVLWPAYETPECEEAHFLQGIAGTLELFHRSTLSFQDIAGEVTGHPVAVFQRVDQAGYKLPIDERILADTDTLMVFGLDHLLAEQEAAPEEIEASAEWLQPRRYLSAAWPASRCRLHRRPRATPDGIPAPRRPARAAPAAVQPVHASLMKALDVPVHNTGACARPSCEGTKDIAPLTDLRDLDAADCSTTSRHSTSTSTCRTTNSPPRRVTACACSAPAVDPHRPHPFTAAGNNEFNALMWMPPNGQRCGDIVLIDSTHFTTLFGGTDSLRRLWRNLALMPISG